MATVVILHAAEDTLPARALAEKLRQAKLTVVTDKQPGEDVQAAARSADLCLALWSPRSVGDQALLNDAASLKAKVLHATMQSAAAPEAFRTNKVINLTGWRGEDDFAAWRQLANLVTEKLGVAPLPPPAPRPPSGFFQPGKPNPDAAPAPAQRQTARPAPAAQPRPAQRPAPQPRQVETTADEPKRGGMGLIIGGAVAAVVIIAGGYFAWTQTQQAQTTSAVWEDVERNDAAALRAFINGAPGAYRDDAVAALAELEERSFEAASDADSIESLEAFLSDFPESEHAIAVRGRIAELASQSQPPAEALPASPSEEPATPDPDLVPPDSAPTAPGPAPDTGTGGPVTLAPPAPEPTPAATDPPVN
jgi:hypothetical protein